MTELEQNLNEILLEKQTKIIPENIKEGVTVLGIEGSYSGLDTSDATAVETDILEGKTAYVNGNKITGTLINQNITKNIFIQETEPEIKEGFWFKNTNIKINNISVQNRVENLIQNYTWESETNLSDIPYPYHLGYRVIRIGDYIYLFGAEQTGDDTTKACRYNYKTNIFEMLSNSPVGTNRCALAAVGTNIYIVGGGINANANKTIYKYDTLSDTYTLVGTLNNGYTFNDAVSYGTDIYIFSDYVSGQIGNSYKFDTLTNSLTTIKAVPFQMKYGQAIRVKDTIYVYGGWAASTMFYKYDIATNTYSRLIDLPYSHGGVGGHFVFGECIYMCYVDMIYIYDTVTNTFKGTIEAPGIMPACVEIPTNNNTIKILNFGISDTKTKIGSFTLNLKENNENTLFVFNENSNKSTQLYNDEKLEGRLPISFKDVSLYTTDEGYNLESQRYYGNGTEWVPIEENIL